MRHITGERERVVTGQQFGEKEMNEGGAGERWYMNNGLATMDDDDASLVQHGTHMRTSLIL